MDSCHADTIQYLDRHAGGAYRRKLPSPLFIAEINKLLSPVRVPSPAFLGVCAQDVFLEVRDRAMLELMSGCGTRVHEISNLDWRDTMPALHRVRFFGKGSKQRIVPLGSFAMEALKDYATHTSASGSAKRKVQSRCFSHRGQTHQHPHHSAHTVEMVCCCRVALYKSSLAETHICESYDQKCGNRK